MLVLAPAALVPFLPNPRNRVPGKSPRPENTCASRLTADRNLPSHLAHTPVRVVRSAPPSLVSGASTALLLAWPESHPLISLGAGRPNTWPRKKHKDWDSVSPPAGIPESRDRTAGPVGMFVPPGDARSPKAGRARP